VHSNEFPTFLSELKNKLEKIHHPSQALEHPISIASDILALEARDNFWRSVMRVHNK
jgi:hypothetical protein